MNKKIHLTKQFQDLYNLFLSKNKNKVHMAAHSHHYWPDCTFEAQKMYWNDSSEYADSKWTTIIREKELETKRMISKIMNTSDPNRIVFVPNTHDLVYRIISSFYIDQISNQKRKENIKILTTNSEFYSFDRQFRRWAECGFAKVNEIDVNLNGINKDCIQEINNTENIIMKQACAESYDIIYLSHVIFNSGIPLFRNSFISELSERVSSTIIIDGYHSLGSIEVDLSKSENSVFYIGGGYKYLQGGEGCSFGHIPYNVNFFPVNTGWFAQPSLENIIRADRLPFLDDSNRFKCATMDLSAMYRLNASLKMIHDIELKNIISYIKELQTEFLNVIDKLGNKYINRKTLLLRKDGNVNNHGQFFAFMLENSNVTKRLHDFLLDCGIITDYRSNVIRFGFAIYHDKQDYKRLEVLKSFY